MEAECIQVGGSRRKSESTESIVGVGVGVNRSSPSRRTHHQDPRALVFLRREYKGISRQSNLKLSRGCHQESRIVFNFQKQVWVLIATIKAIQLIIRVPRRYWGFFTTTINTSSTMQPNALIAWLNNWHSIRTHPLIEWRSCEDGSKNVRQNTMKRIFWFRVTPFLGMHGNVVSEAFVIVRAGVDCI